MTAERFLEVINQASMYRDKGKSRLNRAMWHYFYYLQAYHARTLLGLVGFAFNCGPYRAGIRRACDDRYNGRPPLEIPELDALEDIQRLKRSLGLLPASQSEGEQK